MRVKIIISKLICNIIKYDLKVDFENIELSGLFGYFPECCPFER